MEGLTNVKKASLDLQEKNIIVQKYLFFHQSKKKTKPNLSIILRGTLKKVYQLHIRLDPPLIFSKNQGIFNNTFLGNFHKKN